MEFYLVSFKLGVPPHRLWPRAAGDDVLGAARHQGGHIHPPRARKADSLIIRAQYFWKFLLSNLRGLTEGFEASLFVPGSKPSMAFGRGLFLMRLRADGGIESLGFCEA